MNDESSFEFACPECGNVLLMPPFYSKQTIECPHCYAEVTTPIRVTGPEDESPSKVIENSPLEFPRKRDRDFKITNVVSLWMISIFMRFIFPIPTISIGLFMLLMTIFPPRPPFGEQSFSDSIPLRLLFAVPQVVAGIHSFRAGRSLARLQNDAIRRVNIFLAASVAYSAAFWLGFAFTAGVQKDMRMSFGIALGAWLMMSVFPLFLLSLYLNLSKRVTALYSGENLQSS
jgi:hypothetical protein